MSSAAAIDLDGEVSGGAPAAYNWETFERTWDTVEEDETGALRTAEDPQLRRARQRRRAKLGKSVRRGMIRYLLLVVDLSEAAKLERPEPDFLPSRQVVVVRAAQAFVRRFFDENPISQLGVIVTRDRIAEKVSDLGGSAKHHVAALEAQLARPCSGAMSLMNSLEMALTALRHAPAYGLREALVLSSAISTCDPGDIFTTVDKLRRQSALVSAISVSSEVYVLRTLCERTGGTHRVARDGGHLAELLAAHIPPPVETPEVARARGRSTFMQMGFPQRKLFPNGQQQLCWAADCTLKLCRAGFSCPRCKTDVQDIPVDCPACGLRLVSSPMLARSYHHLFPVANFVECAPPAAAAAAAAAAASSGGGRGAAAAAVKREPAPEDPAAAALACFGCLAPLAAATPRFGCSKCHEAFCIACDSFVHDSLHNCPGCIQQSPPGAKT